MSIPGKRWIPLMGMVFTMNFFSPAWAEEPRTAPLKLKDLIAEALDKNPEVQAAKSRWEVLRERPPQAGSLEDPMLGLAVVNLPMDTFSFDQEDMTMKELSITQRVPYPGKRSLRSEMAQKEAEAVYSEYEEAKNKTAREIKLAYYELFYVNKAIEITEKNREVLKLLNKIAETKYSVGEGIQADILKSQLDLSRMIDELIVLTQMKRMLQAKINTLLNRPAFAPLGEPEGVALEKFSSDAEELVKQAVAHRPLVQSMKRMVERNKVGLKMAERESYPDFEFKLAYGQRDDGPMGKRADMMTAMIAVSLPLWHKSKQGRKVAESQKDVQAAQDQLTAMVNEIRFMISEKYTQIEKSEKQLELLKTGIIPQATLALDSAMSSYRVNKVDYMTLLDNLMNLFKYEIQYYRLLTEHRKNIAEIEAVVGKLSPEEKKG